MNPKRARLPDDLAHNCGYLLSQLGFRSRSRFTEAIAPLGIRPAHYGILSVLMESGPITQAELAGALRLDSGWLVGLLDELEAEGLVVRAPDPVDRRRHAVSLTPAGRRRRQQPTRVGRHVEDEVLRSLAPEEREELRRLLRRLWSEYCRQATRVGSVLSRRTRRR